MKVLHYALGFPPYARGGLTKYALDLMISQVENGFEVGMLWPGEIRNKKTCKVINRRSVAGIKSYELINPLPLPQIYGINNFNEFTAKRNIDRLKKFIESNRPDVVHFHTLMGVPAEFIELLNKEKIRTVYTTHDFFGLCPKTILFFNHKSCANNRGCIGCMECNAGALSINKMILLQTQIYRTLKESALIRQLRKKAKKSKLELAEQELTIRLDMNGDKQYVKLREFYLGMLKKITCLHFNSSYMRDIYANYMKLNEFVTLPISNREIAANMSYKNFENPILRLTYVGAMAEYKGIRLLLAALDELFQEDSQINGQVELHIYGESKINRKYVINHNPYKYQELPNVMAKTDLLCVPREVSFGFSVLEGMSYGVPVLVTEEVGAKDLIEKGITGFVCDCSVSEIKRTIQAIVHNRSLLKKINTNLVTIFKPILMESHCQEVTDKIYRSYI